MGRWITAPVECRICGYGRLFGNPVSVFPEEADEDHLECPNCGHFTAQPREDDEGDAPCNPAETS